MQGSLSAMTAHLCVMNATCAAINADLSPQKLQHRQDAGHPSQPLDACSGEQTEGGLSQKEYAKKKKNRKNHSLHVATTRSQREAQEKSTTKRQSDKRAKSDIQKGHTDAGRRKGSGTARGKATVEAEQVRCEQCDRWFTPEPCIKHPDRIDINMVT